MTHFACVCLENRLQYEWNWSHMSPFSPDSPTFYDVRQNVEITFELFPAVVFPKNRSHYLCVCLFLSLVSGNIYSNIRGERCHLGDVKNLISESMIPKPNRVCRFLRRLCSQTLIFARHGKFYVWAVRAHCVCQTFPLQYLSFAIWYETFGHTARLFTVAMPYTWYRLNSPS